jgi:hypothetical protein
MLFVFIFVPYLKVLVDRLEMSLRAAQTTLGRSPKFLEARSIP